MNVMEIAQRGRERLFKGWGRGSWEFVTFDGDKTYCLEGAMGLDQTTSHMIHIKACGSYAHRDEQYQLRMQERRWGDLPEDTLVFYRHLQKAIFAFMEEFPDHPTTCDIKTRMIDWIPGLRKTKLGNGRWKKMTPVSFNDSMTTTFDDIIWVWDRATKFAEIEEAKRAKKKGR